MSNPPAPRSTPGLEQLLLNSVSDAVITTDPRFVIVGWNRAAEQIYGWPASEAIGRSMAEVVPTSYVGGDGEQARQDLQSRGHWTGEVVQTARDGRLVVIQASVNLIRDEQGQSIGVVAVNRDATELRKARRALDLSRDIVQVLLSGEPERTLTQALRVLSSRFGCREAQLRVVDAEGIERVWARDGRLEADAELGEDFEAPILHRDGRIGSLVLRRWDAPFGPDDVELLIASARQMGPALASVLDRDRSAREQARLEAQVHQAQRMESIGRLAGGIAHDFNNLLTVIMNHAERLEMRLPDGAAEQVHATQILEASQRAATLTAQLLAFSRRQVQRPRVLCLDEVVQRLDTMLRRLIGEDITVHTQLGTGHVRIRADQSQLEQVVVNLVVNARDAMPRGGQLRVRTEVAADGGVLLVVRDNGVGMDQATQERLFEPFFTTKPWPEGTGLGLATVYGIVTQSGGRIAVRSEVDAGTTFEVWWPQVSPAIAEEAEPADEPAVIRPGTGATVLVVEDEAGVLELVQWVLSTSGYQVLTASDGAEALHLYADTAGQIDLVISDVVMPEVSGPELVDRLLDDNPDLRVLYMSGYPGDSLSARGVLRSDTQFLPKPFRGADLLTAVARILDPSAT